jgi:hypothetical protein
MPDLTVTCPGCHRSTSVPTTSVVWHQTRLGDGHPFYTFTCPDCGPVRQPIHPVVERLLHGAGVPVTWWPPEVTARPAGPPLTTDDLIDLYHDLANLGAAA